jgi:thiopurine S-methyltransferase
MAQGFQVLGVELSPIAVDAFFTENQLTPVLRKTDHFSMYETDNLQLLCGDFFDLTPSQLAHVKAVFDRAALVALPQDMRGRYVEKMRSMLPSNTVILLVTFDYPQDEMPGPPFSVTNEEINRQFGNWCDINLMHSAEILDQEPRFRERGLTTLQENIYRITAK